MGVPGCYAPSHSEYLTCPFFADPPRDVAHLQFRCRIAFKLVWCPPEFETFVLVDDEGALLNEGDPCGHLPHIQERKMNYRAVQGSKYGTAAVEVGAKETVWVSPPVAGFTDIPQQRSMQ